MSFRRMAGVSGLVFVALMVGSFIAYGTPPSWDAPASEIAQYVADADGYLLAGGLAALGSLGFGVFIAGFVIPLMASDREHREGYGLVVFGSALVTGAAVGVAVAALATLGLRLEELDGPTTRALWDLSNASYSIGILFLVTMAGGAAAAILKRGLMARWFGWLSALVSASGLLAVAGLVSTGSTAMLVVVGFFAFLIWTLTASILMVRSGA